VAPNKAPVIWGGRSLKLRLIICAQSSYREGTNGTTKRGEKEGKTNSPRGDDTNDGGGASGVKNQGGENWTQNLVVKLDRWDLVGEDCPEKKKSGPRIR